MAGTFLLAAALLLAGPAAADSMRCGSKLMTDGDPSAKVEALCGPPAGIERREVNELFGYCLVAWRVSGLPNPGEEAKSYLGGM